MSIPEFRQAKICECGSHGFVGLTRGMVSLFSPEDLHIVENQLWCVWPSGPKRRGYPGNRKKGLPEKLHQRIISNPGGDIDHINGDRFDNQRSNLRAASRKQNSSNKRLQGSSDLGLKGVARVLRSPNFVAQITVDGKTKYLGVHPTPEAAARAYDAAAIRFQGEFARTNAMLGLIPSHNGASA